ncbi:nuclear transport factor 2 family protein [Thermosynechococcus sp. JY1334]|uniref:nuclear transport factor 2 family protein n=1 Tax=unclassified Thermosynechococcus TaxID=2622553 RepID=UPI002671B055|nr:MULTISPECIES: nuclear transport factor 2 family protein [unclassified Thermosynechococcus]MDR5639271.1 nuclear transport factor 2 family protein [Thermosynechococcus sp. PP42]MDR7898369.1 nuclear transport factor 2 family protein [Thermosynechococcus sp. JY1332]MDR7905770.1 nuclear transport factor 2 family protein [Thermosynechococcus sp. JY1334]MDR7993590.1 nuclear transport factor 2 family protein [Thermosynechococcus sp. TG252]WKT85507.1 nuclear transport factor 2 family protein [Thermo
MTHLVQGSPILGIDEPTLIAYFAALNEERYEDVAALFAEEGVLYPPFEDAVVGRGAIAHYLHLEAVGMRAEPLKGELLSTEGTERRYRLVGKAKLPLFSVNVAWQFGLNAEDQITFVKVDLLATLEELLSYQPLRQQR